MKTLRNLLLATLAVGLSAAALHAEKIVAGPKGGRLLSTEPHQAEFFVTSDRRVEVTFYDAALKPTPILDQVVSITAETASGKMPLEMRKTETGFVSAGPLPAGEPYRVVMQVREKAGAKPQNFRINLNLAECGECKKAEYACICDDH